MCQTSSSKSLLRPTRSALSLSAVIESNFEVQTRYRCAGARAQGCNAMSISEAEMTITFCVWKGFSWELYCWCSLKYSVPCFVPSIGPHDMKA